MYKTLKKKKKKKKGPHVILMVIGFFTLQPSSGTVFRSAKVRIAIFNQHHVDGLDLRKSSTSNNSCNFY